MNWCVADTKGRWTSQAILIGKQTKREIIFGSIRKDLFPLAVRESRQKKVSNWGFSASDVGLFNGLSLSVERRKILKTK